VSTPSVLVIIFQIQITDFLLCGIDAKRQAPVARDGETPGAFAVPRQSMGFPRRKCTQLLWPRHVVKESEHLAELVHSVGRYAFGVVLRVEPFQTLMDDVPYFHAEPSVACNLTLVKVGGRRGWALHGNVVYGAGGGAGGHG